MSFVRNLDLNLLKIFDAVYVCGSVSGASRKLGISQPSVSRGLNKLRIHFEDPLFERSGNGVMPTIKAEEILESIRGALSLINSTNVSQEVFDPAAHTRQFRLIMPDPAEYKIMPNLINRLPEGSPVSFEVLAYSNIDLSQVFADEKIDLGVIPFVPQGSDIVYRKIYSDRGALIARKGHHDLANGFDLSLLARLSFVALPDHLFRLSPLDEALSTKNLRPRIVYTTHKISSVPLMVSQTDLVAFMPLEYATMLADTWNVDVFALPDTELTRKELYLAYARTSEDDPAIRWICDEIGLAVSNDVNNKPTQ